jgi:hypothetical protein
MPSGIKILLIGGVAVVGISALFTAASTLPAGASFVGATFKNAALGTGNAIEGLGKLAEMGGAKLASLG